MRKSTLLVGLVVGALLIPVAVFASHSFNDVPDDHTFHDAIAWMKDNGVTVGFNPPSNTNGCPEDNVPGPDGGVHAASRREPGGGRGDWLSAGTAHEATRMALADVPGTSSGTATSIATLADPPRRGICGHGHMGCHRPRSGRRRAGGLQPDRWGCDRKSSRPGEQHPRCRPGEHGERGRRHPGRRRPGESQLLG